MPSRKQMLKLMLKEETYEEADEEQRKLRQKRKGLPATGTGAAVSGVLGLGLRAK